MSSPFSASPPSLRPLPPFPLRWSPPVQQRGGGGALPAVTTVALAPCVAPPPCRSRDSLAPEGSLPELCFPHASTSFNLLLSSPPSPPRRPVVLLLSSLVFLSLLRRVRPRPSLSRRGGPLRQDDGDDDATQPTTTTGRGEGKPPCGAAVTARDARRGGLGAWGRAFAPKSGRGGVGT